jgi:sedoheptulokinase
MPVYVGLDIGTSSICAVALNPEGELLASASADNDAGVDDLPPGYAEQSPGRIYHLALSVLAELAASLGAAADEVVGIGLSGQQHGVLVADADLGPLTNLVSWQDRRAGEEVPGTGRSFLEHFIDAVPDEALAEAGSRPGMGYMGVTLYWLLHHDAVPERASRALIVHDWVAARLCGEPPAADASDAASTGLFNVRERRWDERTCAAAGVDPRLLPPIREAGSPLGALSEKVARETGLPAQATVHVPLGDNQASVLASLREPAEEVLCNVGTGGQVSAVTDRYLLTDSLESRPFPAGRLLAAGVSLCGGAAFSCLADHYADIVNELTGESPDRGAVMRTLSDLAEGVPPGADGLRMEPYFLGSRRDPARRGRVTGMTPENSTPGHLARACMEGIVAELAGYYDEMVEAGLKPRGRLVGSGNGMRRNPVMREAAAEAFGMPVAVPAWDEEAACGAALSAMVGAGEFKSFEDVSRIVRYAS